MKQRSPLFTARFLAVPCMLLLLCSCAIQDPTYAANFSKIKDTDFPPNYIVGLWAYVSKKNPVTGEELKAYTEINANGRGRVRDHALWRDHGGFLSKEAEITWRYLGKNRWEIFYPPSTAYRITERSGTNVTITPGRGFSLIVRYYEDKLYSTTNDASRQSGTIFVRATEDNVSQLVKSVRSQPQLIKLRTNHRTD